MCLLVFSTLIVLLQAADTITDGAIQNLMENRFVLTAAGQPWRLFTAQFIHIDWLHVAIDVICIAVVWVLVRRSSRVLPLCFSFLVAGTIGQLFALLAWRWGLTGYTSLVGSSDALHGLFYLYIRRMYDQSQDRWQRFEWLIVMGFLLGSIAYTCATGTMIMSGALRSPGYNHIGGIVVFALAVELGWLKTSDGTSHDH
ncbi:MAG: rhomboid family intramembrane serine protease [Candidatus Nealsonbacteria bacterium]|nr:rhomboid family intramembrane serine protease [Candidatus Nealsonbacteria bacterium]